MSKADNINKVIALIILLVLCLGCLGMGATGAFMRFKKLLDETKPTTDPIYKDFFQDGNLNFYSGSELAAEYECQSSYCGWAYERIDDGEYALKYYKQDTVRQYSDKIDNRYAFIVDGNPDETDPYYFAAGVKVYDIQAKAVIAEFKAIKNYGTTLFNNTYIAQDTNGKWGIIDLAYGKVNTDLEFDYDYIGIFYLADGEDNGTEPLKDISKYVVLQDGGWYVIDSSGTKLTARIPEPIQGYEGNMIVTGTDSMSIYNTNGSRLFSDGTNVLYSGRDLLTINNDTDIDLVDANTGESKWHYIYSNIRSVALQENGSKMEVAVNGMVDFSYDLNQ